MFVRLVLVFVITPLVELALLIYLGTIIGVWYTILIVVITGIIGAYLARSQGMATVYRIQSSVGRGEIPSNELFEGALILVGGLLLLTPGIVTDALGFTLLIPQTRRVMRVWLLGLIRRRIERGEIHYWQMR
ncbi:MAG: FxsA family protein [Chloroflexota bacterium]|nr:FxsA family protein [Chloroflexota bacterium]